MCLNTWKELIFFIYSENILELLLFFSFVREYTLINAKLRFKERADERKTEKFAQILKLYIYINE